jgi:hypothetical protein
LEKKAQDEFADNCVYVVENLNFQPEEFGYIMPDPPVQVEQPPVEEVKEIKCNLSLSLKLLSQCIKKSKKRRGHKSLHSRATPSTNSRKTLALLETYTSMMLLSHLLLIQIQFQKSNALRR